MKVDFDCKLEDLAAKCCPRCQYVNWNKDQNLVLDGIWDVSDVPNLIVFLQEYLQTMEAKK